MRTAIFSACFDQLDSIREFVNHATRDAGMDEPGRCAVEMAADEACSNIIEHAYQGLSMGEIECLCEFDDVAFTIILRDHGQPFDMSSIPVPDLTNALENRKVGGLGVFLIRELMDEVSYESKGKLGNILTLKKKLTR
jgi:serine/threonine-protein kinase RsbW